MGRSKATQGSREGAGVSQRGDGGLPDPQTGPQQGKQSQVKWWGMEGKGGPGREPPGFSQDCAPWPWGCRRVPPPLPHPTFIAALCCHLPCSASSVVMEQRAVLTETSLGAGAVLGARVIAGATIPSSPAGWRPTACLGLGQARPLL